MLTGACVANASSGIPFEDVGVLEAGLTQTVEAGKFLPDFVERDCFDADGALRGTQRDGFLGLGTVQRFNVFG